MEKCGFVAIIGQPNVGKSTILNGILKEKVAIVTKKPETTRDSIKGIWSDKKTQIIFTDTPGIHKPHDLLGKLMVTRAESSLLEADIILFITDKKVAFNKNDENILNRLPDKKKDKKVLFVINKIDKIKNKKMLLPVMKKANKIYPFNEIIPMSALKEKDLDELLETIKKYLPEGPFLYPADQLSDKSTYFHVQEIIREKVLTQTYEEIPHAIAVVVDEVNEKKNKQEIYATIYVERTSQKSIIIGKGGAMLKKIGELARKEIEEFLGCHVYLNLWAKVENKWKKDPASLRKMGYTDY